MLRSILVGLDGTHSSDTAVELGIRWASQSNALLVGLGIIDEPSIRRPQPVPLGGGHFKAIAQEVQLAQETQRVEQVLERFALRTSQAGVACKLLEVVGTPSEQILLESQRYDLILLGRETCFCFGHESSPDNTIYEVVKNGPRPVVRVPRNLTDNTDVVIGYDGSLQSARAVQSLEAVGIARGQQIHIVSVAEDAVTAARTADRAVEFLRSHELRANALPVKSSQSPAMIILEKAQELNAGLIVMGAYGKRTMYEFFFGSSTSHMLANCELPLYLDH